MIRTGRLLLLLLFFPLAAMAQGTGGGLDTLEQTADTIIPSGLVLQPLQASEFLSRLTSIPHGWDSQSEPFREALIRLLEHYIEPFDSVTGRANRFPLETFVKKLERSKLTDTLPVRWLNDSTFLVDTVALDRSPLVHQKMVTLRVLDASQAPAADSTQHILELMEDFFLAKDTSFVTIIDSLYLSSRGAVLHHIGTDSIFPTPLFRGEKAKRAQIRGNKLIVEGRHVGFENEEMLRDSIRAAVGALHLFIQQRDSLLVRIGDLTGQKHPLWLTAGSDSMLRLWVKNSQNDSITVWVANPTPKTIALHLDDDLRVEVLEKVQADDLSFYKPKPSLTLAKNGHLDEIPIPWQYGLTSSFSLSGNYLSNWSRGGESTLSSLLDLSGKADYNNKAEKIHWANNWRLRYGFTWTDDENGLKTNIDILEVNSQYNKLMREKLDFSSVFYFKTQVANSFNYEKDQPKELKSRFLNPASFTIGAGAEYKPNKKISVNLSPLSYKNTFVLDTISINQISHGIEMGHRSKQEMGGQLLVRTTLSPLRGLDVKNSLRLFSNYLNKPQNVDVDWELDIEKQISWYFKIRLNFHLIYDDDVLFDVTHSNGVPVLLPDGTPKRVPRAQINQFVGLTLSFKM